MSVPLHLPVNDLFLDEQDYDNVAYPEDSTSFCDDCESDYPETELHTCSSCSRQLCNECFMSDFDSFCYDCQRAQE